MKDVIISGKRIKKEIAAILSCFTICFFVNVGAICYYNSPWIEVVSSLLYVLIGTAVIYFLWSFVRVLYVVVKNYIFKNQKRK